MKKYCKYCNKNTEMDLLDGKYWECQECHHRPYKINPNVKCSRCGYEWESKAKLNFVTCPNCQIKTKKKK